MTHPNSTPLNKNKLAPNLARTSKEADVEAGATVVEEEEAAKDSFLDKAAPPPPDAPAPACEDGVDLDGPLVELAGDLPSLGSSASSSSSKSSPTSNSLRTLRYRSSKRRKKLLAKSQKSLPSAL
mmetsp:Transcript_111996/g.321845  ORF Transcript_111996/g.321845 Transcript_111996/m.321845 type:complete len:125 (+) Transcript_111996:318-692(+)